MSKIGYYIGLGYVYIIMLPCYFAFLAFIFFFSLNIIAALRKILKKEVFYDLSEKDYLYIENAFITVLMFAVVFICYRIYKSIFKDKVEKIKKEYDKKQEKTVATYEHQKSCLTQEYSERQRQLEIQENKIKTEYNNYRIALHRDIEKREERIRIVLNNTNVFKQSASLYADLHSCIYKKDEDYLRYKSHPSPTSADKIRELRAVFKEEIENLKSQLYRYEFIIQVFPELKEYVENDEATLSLTKQSISEFKSNYDYSKDYLSTDEWNKLSDEAKWQLALDRYKDRRRSNSWTAGVEYELYCAWILRKHGYTVIEHGAERKLNDLGRDLIATDGIQTYIIQCKRYSEIKGVEIHENTICQLFGTTLHYTITQELSLFQPIPVLIYTGKVSDVAREFANKLGVVLYKMPMGDYPMVKCNINNGNKIFHLPFDQQYWNTKIDFSTGEFYASTVQEAIDAGFRRAYRWRGNAG
jgi:hypothetical protein